MVKKTEGQSREEKEVGARELLLFIETNRRAQADKPLEEVEGNLMEHCVGCGFFQEKQRGFTCVKQFHSSCSSCRARGPAVAATARFYSRGLPCPIGKF